MASLNAEGKLLCICVDLKAYRESNVPKASSIADCGCSASSTFNGGGSCSAAVNEAEAIWRITLERRTRNNNLARNAAERAG